MVKYNDYPLAELQVTMKGVIARGGKAHLKFTCDYCKSRQTIATPNLLFIHGKCEECGTVTDIGKRGGNLFVVYSVPR